MITTELISVPTGIVFLSALGTIWLGRIRFATPMLWVFGFLWNFVIGGITGVFLADVPTDLALSDTYFVVAHFHYTIVGGMIYGLFAGTYYWFPKITGRLMDERLGQLHFWWFTLAFNATFLPMFWLGLQGMRRRVADYPAELASVNLWASVAAFMIALSTARLPLQRDPLMGARAEGPTQPVASPYAGVAGRFAAAGRELRASAHGHRGTLRVRRLRVRAGDPARRRDGPLGRAG